AAFAGTHRQDERSDVLFVYSSDDPCGRHALLYTGFSLRSLYTGFSLRSLYTGFSLPSGTHRQDERSDVLFVYISDDPCGRHALRRSSCPAAVVMPCGGRHALRRSSCPAAVSGPLFHPTIGIAFILRSINSPLALRPFHMPTL